MNYIKKNSISTLISVVIVLIGASILLAYRSEQTVTKHRLLQQQTEQINKLTQSILGHTMHGLDLGVRGFGHTKQESLLLPYNQSVEQNDSIFINLENLLKAQQYDISKLNLLKAEVDGYITHCKEMVDLARKDSMGLYKDLLNQDKGYQVWKAWVDFSSPVFEYEAKLNQESQASYETAIIWHHIVQVLLVLIGLPTLGLILYRIKKDEKNRKALLWQLDENNRKHVFNPGVSKDENEINPQEIVDASIRNFQKASEFINHMSAGNYRVEWEGLNASNQHLNEANITGMLIKMQEQLKQGKMEEERRLWINEGIAKFSDITRANQTNTENFALEAVRFFTKYLQAQQGSLFILRETEGHNPFLELAACYAFDRKKFIKKQIEIGQGLVGQAYLEGQTTILTEIPQNYTYITSGLGDATPNCLIIIPIKQNEKVEGILELASFKKFEQHQISFLERCGEIVASALSNTKTTEKMSLLIEELQQKTKDMRQQEEEIRQNMEELMATQEQQRRIGKELQNNSSELDEAEKKADEIDRYNEKFKL